MTQPTLTESVAQVDQLKAEKQRVSVLCRKLARKLSVLEPFTDKYNQAYFNYTVLQDYRSDLVAQIQLAIREERYGF